jgi:hypothetical protein
MLIYNVTVGVDKDIEAEWVHWMKTEHIPDVLLTKKFATARLYKVMTAEEGDSVSYACQYFANSIGDVQAYLDEFAPALREEGQKKFGNKQAAFRTLLQEV